jgi:hypothetical protein
LFFGRVESYSPVDAQLREKLGRENRPLRPEFNRHAKAFVWTATAGSISAKVE